MRSEHYSIATTTSPSVDWFEVHSENFFGDGGQPHAVLNQIRQQYPIAFHGVGLSLGSTDNLSKTHLARLKTLIAHYQPALVSEHLSWSSINGAYLHDLLPLPMCEESVKHLAHRIEYVQEYLNCQILVENASTYLEFVHSDMTEWEFVTTIAQKSGCKILLDINNIYVNACNHKFNPIQFIEFVPPNLVGELHLAGHTVNRFSDGEILIDTHNQRVCDEVWDLYRQAAQRFPHAPTLIEWDKDMPPFDTLLEEVSIARTVRSELHHAAA